MGCGIPKDICTGTTLCYCGQRWSPDEHLEDDEAVNEIQTAGLIPAALLGIAGTYPELGAYTNQHLKTNISDFHTPLSECAIDSTNASYGYDITLQYNDVFVFFDNGKDLI